MISMGFFARTNSFIASVACVHVSTSEEAWRWTNRFSGDKRLGADEKQAAL